MLRTVSLPRQSGAALLLILALLLLGAGTLFLSARSGADLKQQNQAKTALALAQAKQALLGYAMTYAEFHPGEGPGYFPCPDVNNDGSADTLNNSTQCMATGSSRIGRLPWKTLGVEPLRDSAGELLWYAVSADYKASANKSPLNSDSNGLFIVKDAQGDDSLATDTGDPRTYAIALVFAPGEAVEVVTEDGSGHQNRQAAPNDPAQYLDVYRTGLGTWVDNAEGTLSSALSGEPGSVPLAAGASLASVFVRAPAIEHRFNDVLVAITPEDLGQLYTHMEMWVAEQALACLQAYVAASSVPGQNRYPWAAPLNASDSLNDVAGERFGRIAGDLSNTVASNSDMSPTWPSGCFSNGSNWWESWKQQLFVAVKKNFAPVTATGPGSGSANLDLDGASVEAVVLVAGRRLAGQQRDTAAQRGLVANYLEEHNIPGSGAGNIPDGDTSFISTSTSSPGGFNDRACGHSGCPW